MKFQKLLMSLLVLGLVFSSCKKDEVDGNMETGVDGTVTANIDGVAFTSNTAGAGYVDDVFNVTAISGTESIIFTLSDVSALVESTTALSGTDVMVYQPESSTTFHSALTDNFGDGDIVITSVSLEDSKVSGTFSGTLTHTLSDEVKVITNGVFTNLELIQDTPSTNDSDFSFKVDGELWEPTNVSGIEVGGELIINANDGSTTKNLGMVMSPNIDVGTYDFTYFTLPKAVYTKSENNFFQVESGKLNITKHDRPNKEIEATFSIEMDALISSQTVSITEGSFKIKY